MIAGERYGRYVVLDRPLESRGRHKRVWCRCDCGQERAVQVSNLTSGTSQGCRSCSARRARAAQHKAMVEARAGAPAASNTAEHIAWRDMRKRCNAPSDANHADYGGRGIRVCERWDSFAAFLADMGPRPSAHHSLDRIDNNGNYEPGNCRWATASEQARNQRRTIRLTINGETKSLADWSEAYGISCHTVRSRVLSGWDHAAAVMTPPRRRPANDVAEKTRRTHLGGSHG